jgi:ectoine hydroxylase-related dioxygenase (phytanoyl-CoA dioxygenase family)
MVQKIDTKFFKQYGYLFYKNLISKAEIERCLKSAKYMQKNRIMIDKVSKYYENHIKKKNKQILVRIENFLKKDRNLTKLTNNKKIQKILKNLFNEKAVIFKEKINYKLPGCRQDKLHQDLQAGWEKYCKNFISVLISLEKSDLNNGCLQFDISGNNSKKLISQSMKPLRYKNLKKPRFKSFIMSPGDAVFFNDLIPHKSKSNISKKSRIQVYLTYNSASSGSFREKYLIDKTISYPPNKLREKNKKYSYKV